MALSVGAARCADRLLDGTLKVKADITGTVIVVITLFSNWLLGHAQIWIICVTVFKQLGVTEPTVTFIVTITFLTITKLGYTFLGVTVTEFTTGTVGVNRTGVHIQGSTLIVGTIVAKTFKVVITTSSNGLLGTAQVWIVSVTVFLVWVTNLNIAIFKLDIASSNI